MAQKHLWFSNPQTSQLPEGCHDLVSEGSRSEAAGNGSGSSGSGSILQDSSLVGVPGRHNTDMGRISSGNELSAEASPGSLQIYAVDAITLPSVDVSFHLVVEVDAT